MANKAPAKDDKFTEKAVEVFRACARVPVASRARIESSSEGRVQVEVTWTQREIERGKKVSYNRTYFVENGLEGLKKLCTSSCQPAVSNVVKVATVVGCKKKAVLVNDKVQGAEPTAEPQQFIEVWGEEGLEKTISVADLKDHGKIHEDIHFGSFQLFPGGTHLLYIAEKKKPKSASYFSKSSNNKDVPPNKVQAPVMLRISGCDLRCPAQGLLYYKTLKALGKQAKLLYYPKDNHPINTVQSDADAFINTVVWFQTNVAS